MSLYRRGKYGSVFLPEPRSITKFDLQLDRGITENMLYKFILPHTSIQQNIISIKLKIKKSYNYSKFDYDIIAEKDYNNNDYTNILFSSSVNVSDIEQELLVNVNEFNIFSREDTYSYYLILKPIYDATIGAISNTIIIPTSNGIVDIITKEDGTKEYHLVRDVTITEFAEVTSWVYNAPIKLYTGDLFNGHGYTIDMEAITEWYGLFDLSESNSPEKLVNIKNIKIINAGKLKK